MTVVAEMERMCVRICPWGVRGRGKGSAVVLGRRGRIGGWVKGVWEGARRVFCVYEVK